MNTKLMLLTSLLTMSFAANAAEKFSGFLDDYSQLEQVSDKYLDYRYFAPGVEDKLANATALVIPQPVVMIASDSKYTGAQPDVCSEADHVFASMSVGL